MKTARSAAFIAAIAAQLTIAGIARAEDYPISDPLIPVGTLSAFPSLVQTGTHPTLTWNIMHPSKVIGSFGGNGNGNGGGNNTGTETAAQINPPGTIIPTQDVYATVQIIGTGVSNCQGGTYTPPATDLRVSLNGGAYAQLFYGTQANVDPSKRLYIKKIRPGQTLDFGGRYVIGSSWSPFYTTRSRNLQVVSLVNGDTLPSATKFQGQNAMNSFLKPYLDAGNKVKIGPLSILVLMELGSTNSSSSCFDYQDQVVLVTLSRNHPNNGHGNNLDGVDSSNPGQGKGGPNGAVDPSGGYDDEIR